MGTPFAVTARGAHKNVESGASKIWASIKIDPQGKGLESERAPLAIALVLDVSGSMRGDPLAHVLTSCGIVADLLNARDQLAIVTFSTNAGVRCGLTTVDDAGRAQLRASVRDVVADGNTNMHGGIEVAAGVLMTAPAGLRRVMVVLSDGQPNVGLSSASDLAGYVRGLKLAVSTLGFGVGHDENVLDAIATAGSGRYAYIPDPIFARVDLARAALAHGGIVADQLELRLEPADGVELVQMLPAAPLRHGKLGVTATLGDIFVDEGRLIAVELKLDLRTSATGRLADLVLEGRSPDGVSHRVTTALVVDIRVGPPVVDAEAQRDVLVVQADAARVDARAQADRGAMPTAATLLRAMIAKIEAAEGFVRDDGSILAELREQLEDEAANYERKSTDQERAHQRKGSLQYRSAHYTASAVAYPPIRAELVGMSLDLVGKHFPLYFETGIGRGQNDIAIRSGMLSKRHARIVFIDNHYLLKDMGSTNGCLVNGVRVDHAKLAHNDEIRMGDAVFQFRLL